MAVALSIEGTGVKVLLLASVLLLIASLSEMLLTLLDDNAEFNVSQVVIPANTTAAPVQKVNFDTISKWHLFGAPVQKRSPVEKKRIVAPKTKLALEIIGIIHRESPFESFAIIKLKNGVQKNFTVGDKITGNTELTEIGAEGITLLRAGKYESLDMPKANCAELHTQPLSKER